MHSFKARAIVVRVVVLACFAGFVFVIRGKTDDFYLDQGGVDTGAQLLFGGWRSFIGWCGFDIADYAKVLRSFQFAFLLALSLLMLLPRVPLACSIGGQATLLLLWAVFRDISSRWHAIDAWTVAVMAMFVLVVAHWEGRFRDCVSAAAFGIVLGYMPLMRESAVLQIMAPCAMLVAAAVALAFAQFYLLRSRKNELPPRHEVAPSYGRRAFLSLIFRYGTPVVVMVVFFLGTRSGALWLQVRGNNAPMRAHGSGYPLFASLGFANNVYNTAWDDDCIVSQGLLDEGRPWYEDAYGQRKLRALWLSRVLEDPTMFVQGVVAKSWYLARYFSNTLDLKKTIKDGYPIKPSLATLALGAGFALSFIYCVPAFVRIRRDRMFILCVGLVGVFFGSLLPLVLIAPFYLGSAMACFATTAFTFVPAVYAARREEEHRAANELIIRRNTLAYKTIGAGCVAAAVLVLAFVIFRAVTNRTKAGQLIKEEPLQKAQELRQNYAYRFNRLPEYDQQSIIDRLRSSPNTETVFRASGSLPVIKGSVFTPVVAFSLAARVESTAGGQVSRPPLLFIIARLSTDWKMRLPSRLQGPRNSLLYAKKNVAGAPPVHYYLEAPENYAKIADANWDGRYRMFCLPQTPNLQEGEFLYVGAYNFKDGEHGPAGLVLDLISEMRLYREGPVTH